MRFKSDVNANEPSPTMPLKVDIGVYDTIP